MALLNATIKSLYNENIKHNLTIIDGNSNNTKLERYYTETVSTSHTTKPGYNFNGYIIEPAGIKYTNITNGNIRFNMPNSDVKLTEQHVPFFTLNNGSIAPSSEYKSLGSNAPSELIIPGTFDGKPVKAIGYEAFADLTHLRNVRIENGLEFIASTAFFGCTSLMTIVIPNSIKSIDQMAFGGTSITNISIDKERDSISGAPWGARSAMVSWLKG